MGQAPAPATTSEAPAAAVPAGGGPGSAREHEPARRVADVPPGPGRRACADLRGARGQVTGTGMQPRRRWAQRRFQRRQAAARGLRGAGAHPVRRGRQRSSGQRTKVCPAAPARTTRQSCRTTRRVSKSAPTTTASCVPGRGAPVGRHPWARTGAPVGTSKRARDRFFSGFGGRVPDGAPRSAARRARAGCRGPQPAR